MITLIFCYFVALVISTLVAVTLREKLTSMNVTSNENTTSRNSVVLDRMDDIEALLNDTIAELKIRNENNKNNMPSGLDTEERVSNFSEELSAP